MCCEICGLDVKATICVTCRAMNVMISDLIEYRTAAAKVYIDRLSEQVRKEIAKQKEKETSM